MAAKTVKQRPVRVKAALGDPFHLAWPPLAETLSAELVEELKEALCAAGLGRSKGRHRGAGGKRGGKRGDKGNKRRKVREKVTGEKMEDEGEKRVDEKMDVDSRAVIASAMVDKRVASVDDEKRDEIEKAVDKESANKTGEDETDTLAMRMDEAKAMDDAKVEVHADVLEDKVSRDAGLSDDPCRSGWNDASVRREVALGVNEVIRALERDELGLVLVCRSARPPLLPRLLALLCASRAVPAAQLGALSAAVAPLLGLRSVLALGVRRVAPNLAVAAERIGQRLPSLHVPWLSGAGTTTGSETGGETGADRLLPSCVKRIVSNPARKKSKRN